VATPAGFDHVLGVTVVDAGGRIRAQVYGDRLRADRWAHRCVNCC